MRRPVSTLAYPCVEPAAKRPLQGRVRGGNALLRAPDVRGQESA
jgi:hypothetical protein